MAGRTNKEMSKTSFVGLLFVLGPVSSSIIDIHTIYHEMPPYIYFNNGTLEGIFPKIAEEARELCDLNISFTKNTKKASQFQALLRNETENKMYVDEKWFWLALLEHAEKPLLINLGLQSKVLFTSPGMEVIVHRDQIGILPKVLNGMENSQYLIVMALVLSCIFGIIIWFIVRNYSKAVHFQDKKLFLYTFSLE